MRSVIAAATWSVSMRKSSARTSTKTGVAPVESMAITVGAAVFDTVITSSPGPMPSAWRPSLMAFVPLSTPTQWSTPW